MIDAMDVTASSVNEETRQKAARKPDKKLPTLEEDDTFILPQRRQGSYTERSRKSTSGLSLAPPRRPRSLDAIPESTSRPVLSQSSSRFLERSSRVGVLPIAGYDLSSSRRLRISSEPNRQPSVTLDNVLVSVNGGSSTKLMPKRLLDIAQGCSTTVSDEKFLSRKRYPPIMASPSATVTPVMDDGVFFEERRGSLQDRIREGDVRDLKTNSEVGWIGGAWRAILQTLIVWTYDEVNALRLTRALQLVLPFLTGYEAYVMDQVVEALDSGRKKDIKHVLTVAFRNRNVSRILVQQMGPRYDFLWHWSTMITWNRPFDAWGQFPLLGITAFPASENFPSTRNHALASIFRIVLGEGNWLTRVITRGREGLVTDNPNNTAQNLAAESNGFELANRNQFGTYIGRRKTNDFRFAHRLPIDESIVRTFVAQPLPTLLNNGVVHVLRQLAKHWHNSLSQPSGNFAHQRMEQLDPFETLRFHMPVVLLTLSTLRGRNQWDSKVLGPVVKQLQELKPTFAADDARLLVRELQECIVENVCGGVAAISKPLDHWLDAIWEACNGIEKEAKDVYNVVTSVEIGIRLGHDLITQVSWKVPKSIELKEALLNHARGQNTRNIDQGRVRCALSKIAPRDMRTFIELVQNGLADSEPAQMLLGRAKTLLQRELRREYLNKAIQHLSMGEYVTDLMQDGWYWLESEGNEASLYIYDAKVTGRDQHRFVQVESQFEKYVSLADGGVKLRAYVPIAEAIVRAQRAFMNIELDHGTKYSYNAFMEFSYLRIPLRKLVVLSQVTCEALDEARLNILAEVQRSDQPLVAVQELVLGKAYYEYDASKKEYVPFVCKKRYTPSDPEYKTLASTKIVKVPPQSMIVIGGGPTGLIATIHCCENVLASGGVMKLYEARDAFAKGGSTFERAQIVRLDARWIAMLRYHLGIGFEDTFIPASGETDALLGNTLPTQGFVEITIKDLENMLHVEVSKMWSKGLIQVHTDSKAKYDHESNSLTKFGEHLKVDDDILRRFDEYGRPSNNTYSWKVVDIAYAQALSPEELVVGEEYGIYTRQDADLVPFKLVAIDLATETYTFDPVRDDETQLNATCANFPSVYPRGTSKHDEVKMVVVESVKQGKTGLYMRQEVPMKAIRKEKFAMDIRHTHVVEAIGKPHGSTVHFSVTTYEPYGVCCMQGLKVSMGMHNFGEKRWGTGVMDDFRSVNDFNTRIIGDFTKMVRSAPVAKKMLEYMTDRKDKNWQIHFDTLVASSQFEYLNEFDPIIPKLQKAVSEFARDAPSFTRQTLQTRFFETGDNFYLGMEFTREYDRWKNKVATELVAPLSIRVTDATGKKDIENFRGLLMHHIDRLWYDGVLEVIRQGDVYNPGARGRVPRLYLINSHVDTNLGRLPVGTSFRMSDSPAEKYEVIIKEASQIIVRNVGGRISKLPRTAVVKREGDLTRGPDGNSESRVSLATFPVGHYVNFRTMRLNDSDKGYVFAFIGDEQATPHFMRYSGLTGACINAMLFNNFIGQAIEEVPFVERFRIYSADTNWSNGEVVQRGTGANYGVDGFLRPGFTYEHVIDYLHSKVIEYSESHQDLNRILTRDWKIKLAASMVPRGMELNETFTEALFRQLQAAVFEKFIKEVKADRTITSDVLEATLRGRALIIAEYGHAGDYEWFWNEFMDSLPVDDKTATTLQDKHASIALRVEQMCTQVVEYAKRASIYNERISSELSNQPKPVDSIVDDFAVEAQNFANSLTMSAAFASGALAFRLVDEQASNFFSAVLAAANILIAFGTMTESARYKIRNEEARVIFADEKLLDVLKGVFCVMDREAQQAIPPGQNPFVICLEKEVEAFQKKVTYYDETEPNEFNEAYDKLKHNIHDAEQLQTFSTLVATKFIAKTYHMNSYVQESLVNIYKVLDEMRCVLAENEVGNVNTAEAKELFLRLVLFQSRVEDTLQRGATRFGFVKRRKLSHWDIAAVFKYFWSLVCCSGRRYSFTTAPISTETLGITRQAHHIQSAHDPNFLSREIRDLEELYWATRESDISSLIFVTALLVFTAGIVFSVARLLKIALLEDAAFWALAASALGAVLATFHLWRKLGLLLGLSKTLSTKVREAPSTDARGNLRKVRTVTVTQIALTFMRLLAAGAAAVALPWSVAEFGFGSRVETDPSLPFYIALGGVTMAVVSTIFFFVVEYIVRYNLSPKLGEFVCESFREELEGMYMDFSRPRNMVDTAQVQERETWEYVARAFLHKYRFDTVFAADRFGSILQYIQGGMVQSTRTKDERE